MLTRRRRHIKSFHSLEKSHRCPRCRVTFPSKAEKDGHLRVALEKLCGIVDPDPNGSDDPEHGITEDVETALAARDNDNKVNSWEGIYTIIFPGDSIPDSGSFHLVGSVLYSEPH